MEHRSTLPPANAYSKTAPPGEPGRVGGKAEAWAKKGTPSAAVTYPNQRPPPPSPQGGAFKKVAAPKTPPPPTGVRFSPEKLGGEEWKGRP